MKTEIVIIIYELIMITWISIGMAFLLNTFCLIQILRIY
jgi:hypothetical protein